MTTIVVSAVNIRKGGTLTICRQCLEYLSNLANDSNYRIIALVHDKKLYGFTNIEYIEFPDTIRGWTRRLWCEYITMHRISKKLAPIDLWLSLHDTTPRVDARIRAVYCQTSFPFYRWRWHDFLMDFKIPLFAMFTRFAYRINVHSNKYLIVQQQWLRDGLSRLLGVDSAKFIVAPPRKRLNTVEIQPRQFDRPTFFYASTPDCHKNFETLCRAAQLLENEIGTNRFNVIITVAGSENRYARWLYKNWSFVDSLKFSGLMDINTLFNTYFGADCFVFPSKVETWGLPISEFMTTGRYMMLADLPYAHETAAGSKKTLFFDPTDSVALKNEMLKVVNGDFSNFHTVPDIKIPEPTSTDWNTLFHRLLN